MCVCVSVHMFICMYFHERAVFACVFIFDNVCVSLPLLPHTAEGTLYLRPVLMGVDTVLYKTGQCVREREGGGKNRAREKNNV